MRATVGSGTHISLTGCCSFQGSLPGAHLMQHMPHMTLCSQHETATQLYSHVLKSTEMALLTHTQFHLAWTMAQHHLTCLPPHDKAVACMQWRPRVEQTLASPTHAGHGDSKLHHIHHMHKAWSDCVMRADVLHFVWQGLIGDDAALPHGQACIWSVQRPTIPGVHKVWDSSV